MSGPTTGASPLTRGKKRVRPLGRRRPRRIPAHAGKTVRSAAVFVLIRAHPRSRGENLHPCYNLVTPLGASPLTRGKLPGRTGDDPGARRIPAHAGKTCARWRTRTRQRAHPRSRGENVRPKPAIAYLVGASPLTRGKRTEPTRQLLQRGRIPAHAGKTQMNCTQSIWYFGASPLTRGKHFLTCAFIAQIGQILESRELCASSESYSLRNVYATAAPQDQVRSIGLAPLSSRGAS